MFLSFRHSLLKLGKVRIGAGFRLKGSAAWIMLLFYGLFYMCWYMILGTLWLMYGMCYLFFYLPIKGIIKYSKKKSQEKKIADAMSKYTAPSQTEKGAQDDEE